MITAQEVIENYDNFNLYINSLPTDESGTVIPAVCEDLGLDPEITVEMAVNFGVPLVQAASIFHGITYCLWLLREKKGH